MKKIGRLLSIFLFSLFLFSGCRGLKQVSNLRKCEFRTGTVQNITLAGINVQAIKSFSDVSLMDGIKIVQAFSEGRLPLQLTMNVEAKNPNDKPAALGRLDWIAVIDDTEIASGSLNQQVMLAANGGTETIPVTMTSDIIQILKGHNKSEILNFGMNLVGAGNRPTRIGIKIKPYIKVGKKSVPYPGYFKVKYDFGAD